MPLPYIQNKIHNKKWRENNKEAYNEYQKVLMRRRYIMKKAIMELFAILRD
jgi:hypothetical protein